MASDKDHVLAILSLSGGNDGLSTIVPYTNGLYRDYRPSLGVAEDKVIPLNNELGLHPTMAPLKPFWDEGKLAIFLGVGYPRPSYSHFRSMDIWHTCEPEKIANDGWLGRVIQEIDPKAENVLTGVNFWAGPTAGASQSRRAGRLRRRPGDLRPVDRNRGQGPADQSFGRVCAYVRPDRRHGLRDGLYPLHRHLRPQGRGRSGHGAREVQVNGGVHEKRSRPVYEEYCADLPGGFRHPGPVHHVSVQRVRYAC